MGIADDIVPFHVVDFNRVELVVVHHDAP